jgi:hypothetical protein
MINEVKKKRGILFKILILALLVLTGFVLFKSSEFGRKKQDSTVLEKPSKSKVVENKVLELGEENSTDFDDKKFSDLTVKKLQSGGAEFIYQLMIYNQSQIFALRYEVKELRDNLEKYKAQEKLQRMILSYVKLRQKVYGGLDYKKSLQGFELLAIGDDWLVKKVARLKENLVNVKDYSSLEVEFRQKIPLLIASKKFDKDGSLTERLRFNFAKVITIRKTAENADGADGSAVRISKKLQERNCSQALVEFQKMDERHRKVLQDFGEKLKSLCEFEEIDEEIMLHLENLS